MRAHTCTGAQTQTLPRARTSYCFCPHTNSNPQTLLRRFALTIDEIFPGFCLVFSFHKKIKTTSGSFSAAHVSVFLRAVISLPCSSGFHLPATVCFSPYGFTCHLLGLCVLGAMLAARTLCVRSVFRRRSPIVFMCGHNISACVRVRKRNGWKEREVKKKKKSNPCEVSDVQSR